MQLYCDNFNIQNWMDSVWFISGEIILYETTNIIETHIKYLESVLTADMMGMPLLIGIQNNNGTFGVEYPGNYSLGVQDQAARYSPYNAPMNPISLCLVSVDSATGKNMVIWNQPMGIPIDSFLIFKETNQSGVYEQIGAQMNNVFSTFIDTGSYPAIQANRYRLGFRDSCGTVSDTSTEQKTIHLSVNQGQNNSWNLIWDAFEGLSFSTYAIYRGTSLSNMSLYTTIASTLYQYSDLTPPATVFYAIGVVDSAGCSPSARVENNFANSISNIVNPSSSGINQIQASNIISIYPNPATNMLTLKSQLPIFNSQFIITDVLGNEVYHQPINNSSQSSIDISQLNNGIYFYQIKNDKETMRGKFVVEK